MSTTTQQPAPMDPADAFAVLHQRVYAPIFFDKLASDYGIRPQNDAEAMELLTQASILRQYHDAEQEKQAASQPSLLAQSRQVLTAMFGEQSFDDAEDRSIKHAAANLAMDPELAQAVLSLEAAQQAAA